RMAGIIRRIRARAVVEREDAPLAVDCRGIGLLAERASPLERVAEHARQGLHLEGIDRREGVAVHLHEHLPEEAELEVAEPPQSFALQAAAAVEPLAMSEGHGPDSRNLPFQPAREVGGAVPIGSCQTRQHVDGRRYVVELVVGGDWQAEDTLPKLRLLLTKLMIAPPVGLPRLSCVRHPLRVENPAEK